MRNHGAVAIFVAVMVSLHRFVAAEWCFEEAIAPAKRKNVTLDGTSMPLGISIGKWESASLVSEIYSIIAAEILGFNIIKEFAETSRSQIFILAGCDRDAEAVPDMSSACGHQRRLHVALENWYHGTLSLAKWLSVVPHRPVSMGFLTYVGQDGLYISGASHRRGLDHGLALEYFRFYNKSWFDLEPYLPLVSQVDLDRLELCSISLLNNPEAMSSYFSATNDTEDEIMILDPTTNTSKVSFRCYKDKWWVPPTCRLAPETCAAMVTKSGWGLMQLSQRAFFWNMPIALASGKEENNEYVRLNRELKGLMYWWSPDSSFALEKAFQVQFPAHSPSEWSQMIFKTMEAPIPLSKFVAADLENEATYVVEKLKIDDEQMMQLLVDLAGRKRPGEDPAKLLWSVACDFLRKNPDTWNSWLPNATSCASGSGLRDSAGRWMRSDAFAGDARSCAVCPVGHSSVPWARSSICQPCPPGFYQELPNSVSCLPCLEGFIAKEEGQTKCTACHLGSYANSTGMSRCFSCGTDEDQLDLFTTSRLVDAEDGSSVRIRTQGARGEDFCQCKDGYLLVEKRCIPCPKGARCYFNGEISIEPGFWSSAEEPLSVFKCYHKPHACPGGPPGSCKVGRINAPGCAECRIGTRETTVWDSTFGECGDCGPADYFLILIPAVLGILVALMFYGIAVKSCKCSGSNHGSLVLSAINISTLLWSVHGMLDMVYEDPLQAMNLDSYLFGPACSGGGGPVLKFLVRALRLTLGLGVVVPVIHAIYVLKSEVYHFDYITNAAGSAFIAFGGNVMNSCMLPFLCLPHPNGLSSVHQFDAVLCDDNQAYRVLVFLGYLLMLIPIGFVCLCFWLLFWELPQRVLRGDMRFVRCCNFLLCNFRPGAEKPVAMFLCRGVVAALVPFIPSTAGKVCFMNIVLFFSLFVVALGQPWRSSVCNTLDLALLGGMLMLLDLGSYLIPELEIHTLVYVCMVAACLMVLATIGTVIVSVVRFAMLQSNKPYRIYISYHHTATGCYARMLKMYLDKHGIKSFLEDDAAQLSLQELLQVVSQDTETLVFLGTRAALHQCSCVGELVTARVHEVPTVLLAFPSFTEPSEIFIADSGKIIPGVVDLVSLRIGLQDIEETFRWIGDLPTFRIPERMTHASLAQVLSFLMGNHVETTRKTSPDCLILADLENVEVAATAMVLQGLMAPLLQQQTCEEVEVWEENTVPKEVMYVLLVCSDGCFETQGFASWLLQLRSLNGAQVAILPIIAESGFRFPSLTFHSELLRIPHLQSFDLGSYAKIIRALFGELWFFVAFTPQSCGSKELHLRAEQAHALLVLARPLAERLAAVEAETKVQDQDEDTQKAVIAMKTISSGSNLSLTATVRSDLDMAFMAEIYQMYFNPTVGERF